MRVVVLPLLLAAVGVSAAAGLHAAGDSAVHIMFDRPIMFRVPITLDGVLVHLPVYRGDDFEEVATQFCEGHNVFTAECTDAIQAEMWKLYAEQLASRPVVTHVVVDVGGGLKRVLRFHRGDDPVLAAKHFLFEHQLSLSTANVNALAVTIVDKVLSLQLPSPPDLPLFKRYVRVAAQRRRAEQQQAPHTPTAAAAAAPSQQPACAATPVWGDATLATAPRLVRCAAVSLPALASPPRPSLGTTAAPSWREVALTARPTIRRCVTPTPSAAAYAAAFVELAAPAPAAPVRTRPSVTHTVAHHCEQFADPYQCMQELLPAGTPVPAYLAPPMYWQQRVGPVYTPLCAVTQLRALAIAPSAAAATAPSYAATFATTAAAQPPFITAAADDVTMCLAKGDLCFIDATPPAADVFAALSTAGAAPSDTTTTTATCLNNTDVCFHEPVAPATVMLGGDLVVSASESAAAARATLPEPLQPTAEAGVHAAGFVGLPVLQHITKFSLVLVFLTSFGVTAAAMHRIAQLQSQHQAAEQEAAGDDACVAEADSDKPAARAPTPTAGTLAGCLQAVTDSGDFAPATEVLATLDNLVPVGGAAVGKPASRKPVFGSPLLRRKAPAATANRRHTVHGANARPNKRRTGSHRVVRGNDFVAAPTL